jgi:hypothetical protein
LRPFRPWTVYSMRETNRGQRYFVSYSQARGRILNTGGNLEPSFSSDANSPCLRLRLRVFVCHRVYTIIIP